MNTTPPPDYEESNTPDYEEPNRSPTDEHTRKRTVKDQLINWLAARSLLSILVILAAPSLAILLATTVLQGDPSSDPSSTRCFIFRHYKELRPNFLSRLVNTFPFISTDAEEFTKLAELEKEGYDTCIELNERAAVKFSTTSEGRYQASNCGSTPHETLIDKNLETKLGSGSFKTEISEKFFLCYLNPAQYYCSSTLTTEKQRIKCMSFISSALDHTRFSEMDAKDYLLRFAAAEGWRYYFCYHIARSHLDDLRAILDDLDLRAILDDLLDIDGNKDEVDWRNVLSNKLLSNKDEHWENWEDWLEHHDEILSGPDFGLKSCEDTQLELNEYALQLMREKALH